jgi:ABC-type Fe3+ transport system substrate-binding protein
VWDSPRDALIWVASLVLLVLACGRPAASPADSARPASTTAAASQPTGAQSAPGGGSAPAAVGDAAEWQRLQEAARREGKVAVAGQGFAGFRQGLIDGFQKAHEISVEYLGLPTGEVLTRIEREAQAGRVSVDVNIGGVATCWVAAERGLIDPATNLVVDPALKDPSGWRGGALRFVRPTPKLSADFECGLQTAEYVMTDLFVNPAIVPPDSIRSWRDLLKPEFKGKIASHDPRRSGASQTTAGYLYYLFGEQYLRDLYAGQEVTLTADYRQLAEWVARGTYPIGLSLVQAAVEPLRAEGLAVERLFPDDGPGALTAGSGSVMKIKNGPNPNAAVVFLNWFASKEGQEVFEREIQQMSLRTDVAHQVPSYVIPRPGLDYSVNENDPDFYFNQRAPAISRMADILGR